MEISESEYSISDLEKQTICSYPDDRCRLLMCDKCPGILLVSKNLSSSFEAISVSEIHFKEWTCTDRCGLVDKVETTETFLNNFQNELPLYLKHDYIAKSQAQYLLYIKENLKDGEFLVTLDFAENYNFKIQDAVQSYHWSNDQATLHPYVILISEASNHNTAAVHLFNTKMINHLKLIFGIENVKNIIFFSDGCAAQYKNKFNFANLLHYEADFNIESEWHFFATSHGKGACDGVGGTVKRLACRASLQRPLNDQITTPYQLFLWENEYFDNIQFEFTSKMDHEAQEKELVTRFKKAKTIKGTRMYHSFKPIGTKKIECRESSDSEISIIHELF